MYELGHLGLYKNIPKKRMFNPTPDYERDTYEVLQYKSHLRNEFLIPLKANGNGSGVATIRLQSLETQSVKITGNGKFYTTSAGITVLGTESTIDTTLGRLHVKLPAGESCYLVLGKADKLSGLGSTSINVIADGANIPYINYCAINYPLINLSVIRFVVSNSSFTGSIDNTPNLTYLLFYGNLLSSFTGSIDNTLNLTYLAFDNNLLSAFTGSIDNTPKLTYLAFNNNLLSSFTGSIDNTPKLTYLAFYGNLLSAFTGSIDNTPKLTAIDFSNNLLSAFTGSIDNTLNLTYLSFSNNLLSALTGDIGKIVKCNYFRSHINTNCTFTYVTRRNNWTSAYNTIWVSCTSMTSTMVDNLLIDLDASGVLPTGTKLIRLDGLCGAVTSASASARASLVNKGFTVVVNT
jgi:hypothetical protein